MDRGTPTSPGWRFSQSEIVDKMTRHNERINHYNARRAVETLLEVITDELRAGNEINFLGFGTFKTAARAARVGVNPQTGERIRVPARRVIKFTPGEALKRAVADAAPAPGRDPGPP
jgi:DNA-binding protein HU-beta